MQMFPDFTSSTLVVCKHNKCLRIFEVDTGEIVYTPPNFLKPLQSRQPLVDLAEELMAGRPYIEAIMSFETAHNPRIRRERHRGAPRRSGSRYESQAEAAEVAASRVSYL